MAKLNPTHAAEQWKMGKSTLYRAMNNGELSYTTDESGKRFIDHSEMLRVYGEPKDSLPDQKNDSEADMIRLMREMLEKQERASEELVKSLQSRVDSQQEQIAKLLESQEQTTKLLMHFQESAGVKVEEPAPKVEQQEAPAPEPVQETPNPTKRKRSLFQRVLSAVVED